MVYLFGIQQQPFPFLLLHALAAYWDPLTCVALLSVDKESRSIIYMDPKNTYSFLNTLLRYFYPFLDSDYLQRTGRDAFFVLAHLSSPYSMLLYPLYPLPELRDNSVWLQPDDQFAGVAVSSSSTKISYGALHVRVEIYHDFLFNVRWQYHEIHQKNRLVVIWWQREVRGSGATVHVAHLDFLQLKNSDSELPLGSHNIDGIRFYSFNALGIQPLFLSKRKRFGVQMVRVSARRSTFLFFDFVSGTMVRADFGFCAQLSRLGLKLINDQPLVVSHSYNAAGTGKQKTGQMLPFFNAPQLFMRRFL